MADTAENQDIAEDIEEGADIEGEAPVRLGYSFSKANGLLLTNQDEDSKPIINYRKEMGDGPTAAQVIALTEVRRLLGRGFGLEQTTHAEFDRLLSEQYTSGDFDDHGLGDDDDEGIDSLAGDMPTTADLLDTDDDAPVIRLINGLIAQAVRGRGSDIHIEPFENVLSVRLRIDGVLQEVMSLPARLAPVLVSRIKVMARLDIAEKRIPQDGRISLTLGGRALDVRVSTLPSRHGERVVLRLLDRDQARFSIEDLGMEPRTKARFERTLTEPNGVILVTGPTGSGKTTTLYAGLTMLNDATRNILTVEDPVEYALDGVGQTQVHAKVGMTFAAGLRAILRQDPDVVMVGEIRDVETAEIAVQASLTGHLVMSTVHTNSAISAVTRLRDMGVEPFLLASTLKGILAQRLVRRLCDKCKQPYEADVGEKRRLEANEHVPLTLYKPNGCDECGHTGFKGRVGIYELVNIDATLRELIHDDASEARMSDHAFRDAETLVQSGLGHVRLGRTTLEEVLRVSRSDGG